MGVPVHIGPDEIPEVDDPTIKLLTVARRLGLRIGTCSVRRGGRGRPAGSCRWSTCAPSPASSDPDHLPGNELRGRLIKEGRQPRQAVGYLPDGDMVVVNDATHLVDQGPVAVTVLSTRPTSQGLMVFAKLATDSVTSDAAGTQQLPTPRRPASIAP